MKQPKYVNLTSHTINECTTGTIIPRSGVVARVQSTTEHVATHAGCPIFIPTLGAVQGLPEPVEGTIYIVSSLTLEAIPKHRRDVVSPGNTQKSPEGKIIGCMGFKQLNNV